MGFGSAVAGLMKAITVKSIAGQGQIGKIFQRVTIHAKYLTHRNKMRYPRPTSRLWWLTEGGIAEIQVAKLYLVWRLTSAKYEG